MRNKLMLLVVMAVPIAALAAGTDRQPTRSQTNETKQQPAITRPAARQAQTASTAASYNLDWVSINAGGETSALGVNLKTGVSIAQHVTGEATSASFRVGFGYWYGTSGVCPVAMTGDVNVNGSITSADIISLVGYVFKGGTPPLPCEASGDVNCNGSVTSADIIYLVGYVFKGGPAPCDICEMIPGMWSCNPI